MNIKQITKWSLCVTVSLIVLLAVLFLLFSEEHVPFHLTRGELSKLSKIAEEGDADACWALSYYYMEDQEKELYWIKKGAQYGDPRAQYDLYSIMKNRHIDIAGVDATALLNKAAEQNNAYAQEELARQYSEGPAINLEMAEYWLRRAINNGSWFALLDLPKLILKKHTDYESLVDAFKWSSLAFMRTGKETSFADKARKVQDAVIKRAKELGFDTVKLRQDAEAQAAYEEKGIPIELDPVTKQNMRLEKVLTKIRH